MKAAWSRIVGSTRKEVVGWSQASFGVAGMLGLDKLDGLASPYAQNAWVFSGVSMKADALSDAPFRIYTGDVSAMDEGKAVPDTDEYAKLFAMPTRGTTARRTGASVRRGRILKASLSRLRSQTGRALQRGRT